jgi:hypothetical protein
LNPWRERSREAIAHVLKINRISHPSEITKLDPDVRKVLKKDLFQFCPFEADHRKLPYRIYENECKVLLGIERLKRLPGEYGEIEGLEEPEPAPHPTVDSRQESLF